MPVLRISKNPSPSTCSPSLSWRRLLPLSGMTAAPPALSPMPPAISPRGSRTLPFLLLSPPLHLHLRLHLNLNLSPPLYLLLYLRLPRPWLTTPCPSPHLRPEAGSPPSPTLPLLCAPARLPSMGGLCCRSPPPPPLPPPRPPGIPTATISPPRTRSARSAPSSATTRRHAPPSSPRASTLGSPWRSISASAAARQWRPPQPGTMLCLALHSLAIS